MTGTGYVAAWLAVLALIAAAELLFDPNLNRGVGEVLDLASIVVAATGLVAVPAGVARIAHKRGETAHRAAITAFIALLVFAAGVALLALAYNRVAGS